MGVVVVFGFARPLLWLIADSYRRGESTVGVQLSVTGARTRGRELATVSRKKRCLG